jgi:hypothetical protein
VANPGWLRQAESPISIVAEDEHVASYFILKVGPVDTLDASELILNSMYQYPILVVILARLAVVTQT